MPSFQSHHFSCLWSIGGQNSGHSTEDLLSLQSSRKTNIGSVGHRMLTTACSIHLIVEFLLLKIFNCPLCQSQIVTLHESLGTNHHPFTIPFGACHHRVFNKTIYDNHSDQFFWGQDWTVHCCRN